MEREEQASSKWNNPFFYYYFTEMNPHPGKAPLLT
jgi:hypothetical protein